MAAFHTLDLCFSSPIAPASATRNGIRWDVNMEMGINSLETNRSGYLLAWTSSPQPPPLKFKLMQKIVKNYHEI